MSMGREFPMYNMTVCPFSINGRKSPGLIGLMIT